MFKNKIAVLLFAFVVCVGYFYIAKKSESNLEKLNQLKVKLSLMEKTSTDYYRNITQAIKELSTKTKKALTLETLNSSANSNENTEEQNSLINEQSLLIEKLSDQINAIELRLSSNQESESGVAPNSSDAAEQIDTSLTEEKRTADLRIADLEITFKNEPENTHAGYQKSDKISAIAEQLKTQNPEFQSFQINNIDCRVSACKIGIFHPASSHDPEMVMMELIARLDDLTTTIDTQVTSNQDGSSNVVYYLSSN